MKAYRGGQNGKVFYLPRAISDVIPATADFVPEITDEGVLFRFVGHSKPGTKPRGKPLPVPKWAKP